MSLRAPRVDVRTLIVIAQRVKQTDFGTVRRRAGTPRCRTAGWLRVVDANNHSADLIELRDFWDFHDAVQRLSVDGNCEPFPTNENVEMTRLERRRKLPAINANSEWCFWASNVRNAHRVETTVV